MPLASLIRFFFAHQDLKNAVACLLESLRDSRHMDEPIELFEEASKKGFVLLLDSHESFLSGYGLPLPSNSDSRNRGSFKGDCGMFA